MSELLNKLVYDDISDDFSGKREDEKIIYCFTEHWIRIIVKFIQLLVIIGFSLGLLYLLFLLFESKLIHKDVARWSIFPLFIVISYTFHCWTARMFDVIMRIYIVTNTRIIMVDKSIFFKDNKDIIDLKKIQDIASTKSGILQNILSYGDMIITLSSTSSVKIIKNVPDPHNIVEIIDGAKRSTINQSIQDKYNPSTDPLKQVS